MVRVRAEILLVAAAAAACSHAPPAQAIKNQVEVGALDAAAFYDPLFRAGQTWDFRVEYLEETDDGDVEAKAAPPVHCRVTDVRRDGTTRRSHVSCEPPTDDDDLDDLDNTIASGWLKGDYLARPDGVWRLAPNPEYEDPMYCAEPLLGARLAPLRQEDNMGCLFDGLFDKLCLVCTIPDGYDLHAVKPWRDAWCTTSVEPCHKGWRVDCFRRGVGWIGGAVRGYFDTPVSLWREIRWGEAPAFPFGV